MGKFPEWQHKFAATVDYRGEDYGRGRKIKVEAGLHYIQGNSRPYFSVTAEIYRPGAQDIDACGCLHAEVLRHWPKLAPVVALHLSDDTGAPMHAGENGIYHLGFGRYGEYKPEVAASHWRIPVEDVPALRKRLTNGASVSPAWPHKKGARCGAVEVKPAVDKVALAEVLEEMRPRWAAEAQTAIVLLDELRAQ